MRLHSSRGRDRCESIPVEEAFYAYRSCARLVPFLPRRSLVLGSLLCAVLAVLIGGPSPSNAHTAADSPRVSPQKYWLLLTDRRSPTDDASSWTDPVDRGYLNRLRRHDVEPIVQSRWLHAVSAVLSPEQRSTVRALPFVRRIVPVASGRRPAEGPTAPLRVDPPTSPPSPFLRLGASRAPLSRINAVAPMARGLDGRGVRIGFLDAHFRGLRHEAFAALWRENRMIALRTFPEGTQGGNHGMGVASVAVGRAPGTLVGPARGAEVLGATTEYTPSERNVEEDYFVAGLEWLYRRGADVVNVSIGYNTFEDGQNSYSPDDLDGNTGLTTRAVDRAAQLGMTVVVSAGNSGCGSPDDCWYYVNTPADADSAITVGAVGPDSSLADFSSRGPTADGRRKPDVVVQGQEVVAAWNNDGYARVGGTSFASPQVTAVVALMLQVNPDLSPIDVRHLLRQTASRAQAPNNRVGWGVVNADAATRAAERRARATPPASLLVEPPHPDPASSQVTIPIRAPTHTEGLRLTLTTPLGQIQATESYDVQPGPNWLSLDVQSFPPGLYHYHLQGARELHRGTLSIAR